MNNKQYIIISLLLFLPLIVFGTEVPNITNKSSTHSNNISQEAEPKSAGAFQDLTHSGREHVSEKPHVKVAINSTTTNLTKTVYEVKSTSGNKTSNITYIKSSEKTTQLNDSEKNDVNHSSDIVQKNKTKVSNHNEHTDKSLVSSTNQTTTIKSNITASTVKPVVRKPLVTVHDDEADKTDTVSKMNNLSTNVINIDPVLNEKKHTRSNYVVPIVALILSVPLVAAVISILYKRGKDWWLHRNYRRMDYLIEGLYNG